MKVYSGLGPAAFLVLIGCSMCAVAQSPPAPRTYYISSTSGNDDNDGRSPETAWQHLWMVFLKSISKDPFHPGDNVLLKRGDQWDGQIRLQASGTAQKPITLGAYGQGPKPLIYGDDQHIKWEPVARHKGIFTADIGEGSILAAIFQNGKRLKFVNPAGALSRVEAVEVFMAALQPGMAGPQSGNRVWIQTSVDEPPPGMLRVFRSAGVSISDSSYVDIENLDIQRSYTGIDVTHSQQVLVRHNDIQDVLGIGIYLRSEDTACRVESNTVFRSGNTALYVLKGSDNTFRDNWVSHVDPTILGIAVNGDGMGIGFQQSQGSLAEYNYFSHSGGMDFYYEQNSTVRYNYLYRVRSAGAPHGINLQIYGNIYNLGGDAGKPESTGVNAVATGPGTISVFNNTISNANGFFLMGSSNNGGKIVFSDNIASSSTPGIAMTMFGANVASNHNCYFSPGQPVFRYNNVRFASLRTYQQESGLDQGSIFSDPQFASSGPSTPLDFRISPASACNSPASRRLATGEAGRTYDHDQNTTGSAVTGAMQATAMVNLPTMRPQVCKANCFRRPFAVAQGVYLVRLTFAPATVVLRQARELGFLFNGRKVPANFENTAAITSPDGALERDFLVRPDGGSITLEPDRDTDTSSVTEVEIVPFDINHGDGPQVVPW